MAFHETRLPEDIERGAQGGPAFNTTIITLSSGKERRNINWERARQMWDLGYGILRADGEVSETTFKKVRDFFYAREGRAHGFRFKDWTDYEIERQSIGQTDGSNADFQIFKRYSSGGVDFDRSIKKIVDTTVSVWVDSASIAEGSGSGQYEIDLDTGIITLGSTLAAQSGTDVEVECEFDVPVRFDIDRLDLNVEIFSAASIPNIPIVELLI